MFYGDGMKSNDHKLSKNFEEKKSPFSSSDDHSTIIEETPASSDSSSSGSSPSELKKRLQDLPSSNEATRFSSHIGTLGRRLSRKRQAYFHFHPTTNRIEEKDENPEKDQKEHFGEKVLQTKDARARRRARIVLEGSKGDRTMVVTQPSTIQANEQTDGETSVRSSITERELFEQNSKHLRYSSMEALKSYSESCSPLSHRSLNSLNPYRNRFEKESTVLHRNSVLHARSVCNKKSPKDRIELQPISPLSLTNRPTKFGGYRPLPGVILQNLSSGSEAESGNELPSGRMSVRKPDTLISTPANFGGVITPSPDSSQKSIPRDQDDRLMSTSLSSMRWSTISRESLNSRVSNPPRNDDYNTVPLQSDVINESHGPFSRSDIRNSNDDLSSTLSTSRKLQRRQLEENYNSPDTPRSVLTFLTTKNSLDGIVEGSPVLSSRTDVCDKLLNLSRCSSRTSVVRDLQSADFSKSETLKKGNSDRQNEAEEEQQKIMANKTNEMRKDYRIDSSNEFLLNSAFSTLHLNENNSVSVSQLAPDPSLSLKDVPECRISSNFYDKSAKIHCSSCELRDLTRDQSKCLIDYNDDKDIRLPLSASIMEKVSREFTPAYSPFVTSLSESHTVASTPKQIFDESPKETPSIARILPVGNYQELKIKDKDVNYGDNDVENIPVLTLNSQDLSYSTSPSSKSLAEKQLDAHALIMALSNVSLKQKSANDETNNCNDNTISRSTCSDTYSTTGINLSTRKSLNSDEHRANYRSPNSQRSSFSKRSKIPVKIPDNKNIISERVNKSEEDEEKLFDRAKGGYAESTDSGGQTTRDVSPSRRIVDYNFVEKSSPLRNSCRDLSHKQRKTNFRESNTPLSGLSIHQNSPKNIKNSDTRCVGNSSQNCHETKDYYDYKESFPTDVDSTNRSTSSHVEIMRDKDGWERKEGDSDFHDNSSISNRSYDFHFRAQESFKEQKILKDVDTMTISIDENVNYPESFKMINWSDGREKNVDMHSGRRQLQLEDATSMRYNLYDNTESYRSGNETNASSLASPCGPFFTNDTFCKDLASQKLTGRNGSKDSRTSAEYSKSSSDYKSKYLRGNFEEDNQEEILNAETVHVDIQIGDTKTQQTFNKEQDRSKMPQHISPETNRKLERSPYNATPELEKAPKKRKLNDHHEKVRFSLEKLAADQFRRNITMKYEKTVHSESASFVSEKIHDITSHPLKSSSSTPKLRQTFDRTRDLPRYKKKSQDRFPFTISEKTSAVSMKHNLTTDRGRHGNIQENSRSLDRTYKLDVHPSLTRLAGSGMEDTPKEIINYVAYSEQEEKQGRPFGVKGFVRKFSARLRRSRGRCKRSKTHTETSIIYKNTAYHGDSVPNSCSDTSSVKEFRSYENLTNNQSMIRKSEQGSMIKREELRKNERKEDTLEHPRKYDRDDLWVQDFEDRDFDTEEIGIPELEMQKSNFDSSSKDPYSLFFVKSVKQTPESSERALSKLDKRKGSSFKKEQSDAKLVSDSSPTILKDTKENKNLKGEDDENDGSVGTGCLCLRIYQMIFRFSIGSIFKYRSSISRDEDSLRTKRKHCLSLRKKKG